MKQEQIKELLERIRSNKNNETNELVATAEEVSLLNATTEATMSVASARALTTTTISADNYLWLGTYDENGIIRLICMKITRLIWIPKIVRVLNIIC